MMNKDEGYIRRAMDRRLSVLDDSPGRRASILQKIRQEEAGMNKTRKACRASVRPALVFAALVLLGSIAVAAAVNVFELYGSDYEAVGRLAEQTVLEHSRAVVIEDEQLGESVATIVNGYYDGTALVLGYEICNAGALRACIPSEEELRAAVVREDAASIHSLWDWEYFDREEERALLGEFEQAVKEGRPFGLKGYRLEADGQYLRSGEYIPMQFDDRYASSSVHYAVGQAGEWLPQQMQLLDELPVDVTLQKRGMMIYFDGERFYAASSTQTLPEAVMSALVPRIQAQVVHYEGTGVYRGAQVRVELELSQVLGELSIYSDRPMFRGVVQQMEIEAADTQGCSFHLIGGRNEDAQTCRYMLYGNAAQPEEIRVRIYEQIYYGEYEMIPYGTARERSEIVYQEEIVLKPVD